MAKGVNGRNVIRFGDNCKDCCEVLTPDNCIFSKGYLLSRCKICYRIRYFKERIPPSQTKEGRIKTKFNITKEEHNKKLEEQNNVCAICKKECDVNERLSIDHNHQTKEFRGLLCHRCNVALGLVKEDIEILKEMINYLEKHELETWVKG